MKQYYELNLNKIRDDLNLHFAHFTYLEGQCSCCYGPLYQSYQHWNKKLLKEEFGVQNLKDYKELQELDHYDLYKRMKWFIFKNADNCRGYVTKYDYIDDVYVEYEGLTQEEVHKLVEMLQEQLGDEYIVLRPKDDNSCIWIRLRKDHENEMAEIKKAEDPQEEIRKRYISNYILEGF